MTLRKRVARYIHLIKNRQFYDKANIYELQNDLELIEQLLDRAMQGLEDIIDQEGGDYVTFAEIEAQQTLTELKQALGDKTDGR